MTKKRKPPRVCKFYTRNCCTEGDACSFLHVDETDTAGRKSARRDAKECLTTQEQTHESEWASKQIEPVHLTVRVRNQEDVQVGLEFQSRSAQRKVNAVEPWNSMEALEARAVGEQQQALTLEKPQQVAANYSASLQRTAAIHRLEHEEQETVKKVLQQEKKRLQHQREKLQQAKEVLQQQKNELQREKKHPKMLSSEELQELKENIEDEIRTRVKKAEECQRQAVEQVEKDHKSFACAVSLAIMTNPQSAPDGHTYESADIRGWITQQKGKQALTPAYKKIWPYGEIMVSTELIPNHTLRAAINETYEKTFKAMFPKESGDIQLWGSMNSLKDICASAAKESVKTVSRDIPLAAAVMVAATVDVEGTDTAEEKEGATAAEEDEEAVAAAEVAAAAADEVVVAHGVAEEVCPGIHNSCDACLTGKKKKHTCDKANKPCTSRAANTNAPAPAVKLSGKGSAHALVPGSRAEEKRLLGH